MQGVTSGRGSPDRLPTFLIWRMQEGEYGERMMFILHLHLGKLRKQVRCHVWDDFPSAGVDSSLFYGSRMSITSDSRSRKPLKRRVDLVQLESAEVKTIHVGANPANTVSNPLPHNIKGQISCSKRRLTFFIQQRLLLPALLDPINRHKTWQALKSKSRQ